MIINDLKFHHIGVATKNIEKEFLSYEKINYKKESKIFIDKIQNIKDIFITSTNSPRLELLETYDFNAKDSAGGINYFVKNNIKMYHFAYETKNIENDVIKYEKEFNAKIIVPITNAQYFNRICFLILKNMFIIELVELREVNEYLI